MAKQKQEPTEEIPEGKKTKCPIDREIFLKKAKPLALKIGDETKVAGKKEFQSGSFGWYCNEKTTVEIDGVPCKVQMNCSMVLIGSKPEL